MRNLILFSLVVLVTACGTMSADRTETAKQQVAEATAAWVAAYNSRDPGRITSLYDTEAVFWGTSAKTIAATPAGIAEYFKDAGKNPQARVTLGEQHIRVYGDVAINTATIHLGTLLVTRLSTAIRTEGG
jgi:ketosteroid isomerase-like protein